jgi:hypothetical protein
MVDVLEEISATSHDLWRSETKEAGKAQARRLSLDLPGAISGREISTVDDERGPSDIARLVAR